MTDVGVPTEPDVGDGIAGAVTRWALREPGSVAVIDGDVSITRGVLLDWCQRTGERIAQDVPDSRDDAPRLCALLLPRCWAVPFGLIAARFAGLAFLLLDAGDPPARLRSILDQAGAALLIVLDSNAEGFGRALGIDARGERVAPPDPGLEPLRLVPLARPRRLPSGTGHVVFTSGSSGKPKGVLLRDAPLLRTVAAQRALLGVDGTDAAARAPSVWVLSPAFDASLSDIFCAILGQAPLLVVREAQTRWRSLGAMIARHGAGRADLAPVLLRVVPPSALGLGAVVFGGERCDPAAAVRWGEATLALQAYGPTEAAVCAMMARAGPGWTPGLLGRPLPYQIVLLATVDGLYRVVAVDPDAGPQNMAAFNAVLLEPFEAGPVPPMGIVEGEIWLAGDAVAIGYLDAPDVEAARFGEAEGYRVHRTGDFARWQDSRLVWLGRTDRQFGVHGRRIAPEEIEAIAEVAWNGGCVCVPWRGGLALALEAGDRTTTAGAVTAAVTERMGTALTPRAAVVLAEWPRLPSGKSDLIAVAARLRARLAGDDDRLV